MSNEHGPKEYGKHKYPGPMGYGKCEYGCGCEMHSSQSWGPLGLDPFGKCPKNPTDGKLLGGDAGYRHVVEERISDLESRAYNAETALRKVRPSKKKLSADLDSAREEISKKDRQLEQIQQILNKDKKI